MHAMLSGSSIGLTTMLSLSQLNFIVSTPWRGWERSHSVASLQKHRCFSSRSMHISTSYRAVQCALWMHFSLKIRYFCNSLASDGWLVPPPHHIAVFQAHQPVADNGRGTDGTRTRLWGLFWLFFKLDWLRTGRINIDVAGNSGAGYNAELTDVPFFLVLEGIGMLYFCHPRKYTVTCVVKYDKLRDRDLWAG